MKKILLTYDYDEEKIKKLEELGVEVLLKKEKGLVYSDEMKDVEIMMTYHPFQTFDISKLKKLKYIQLHSNGFDQVDKKTVVKNNIQLCNNRSSYTIPIAEWIVGKVLELYKNSWNLYENNNNKTWKFDNSLLELNNKTIGFAGTGMIAQETAKRLKSFNTKILGINIDASDTEYFDKCYLPSDIKEMVTQCDTVISLIPATKETENIFNEDVFEVMKDEVFFLSCSRGQVVDEDALIKYLKNGKIRAAAMDVFKVEPLPKESELWNLDNVIISPHNAFISETKDDKIFELVYENLKRYLNKDKPLLNMVNLNRGY